MFVFYCDNKNMMYTLNDTIYWTKISVGESEESWREVIYLSKWKDQKKIQMLWAANIKFQLEKSVNKDVRSEIIDIEL